MINVLFLMENLTEGGAEKVMRTLVNHMDQNKFRITVQTVVHTDPEKYLVPGIRYKAINRCKSTFGRTLTSWWLRLCAECRLLYPLYLRDDYDIEIAYLEYGPTKFLSGSTNKKARKLAWVHCDLEKRGTVPTKKLRGIYRSYDRVVCVCESVRDAYTRLFGNLPEAVVVQNVIDETEIHKKANAFSVPESGVFTFLFVGRLSYEKGADRLLDACALLKEQGYAFRLQLLGDGPERPSLEARIPARDLRDNVQLLGFRENPYPYFKAADCIVCPSRSEGYSTVVSEALILGKPVIATPCSGMQELLGNSRYGMITGDSTASLFQYMKSVLDDPGLCRHYASAAIRRGRMFSKATVIAETEQFLMNLMQEPAGTQQRRSRRPL